MIYKKIQEEHNHILTLLEALGEAHKIEFQLFVQLQQAFIIHEKVEEETFTAPLLKKTTPLDAEWASIQEEHKGFFDYLKRMQESGIKTPQWRSLFLLLTEKTKTHLHQEEQIIFRLVAKHFNEQESLTMANDYTQAKERLLREFNS